MRDVLCFVFGIILGILGIKYGFIAYIFPVFLVIIIGLVISIEFERIKNK